MLINGVNEYSIKEFNDCFHARCHFAKLLQLHCMLQALPPHAKNKKTQNTHGLFDKIQPLPYQQNTQLIVKVKIMRYYLQSDPCEKKKKYIIVKKYLINI